MTAAQTFLIGCLGGLTAYLILTLLALTLIAWWIHRAPHDPNDDPTERFHDHLLHTRYGRSTNGCHKDEVSS